MNRPFETMTLQVNGQALSVPCKTVLLIEHNMHVVMQTAHKISVLNFGEILAEGTPEEIHANSDVQSAYLGTG